jgi:hypothetical protein
MQTKRFEIGDRVTFGGRMSLGAASGVYEVVRVLPVEAGQVNYRIKSIEEPHERVVGEEHLTRHGAPA